MKKSLLIHPALLASIAGFAAPPPNIVIIFNDDQGYQDLGCYGSPDIKTPRVDQLAQEGMRFTDFLVASPVCSPSRASLLTGLYPHKAGVRGVFFPNRGYHGLAPSQVTIAETLRDVGYATAAVGKWHLGDHVDFLPTNQGFDSYFGIPYSNDMYPAQDMRYAADCIYLEGETPETIRQSFEEELRRGNPVAMRDKVPLMRDEECIEFPADQRTITRRYADAGIRFIRDSVDSGKPFFLYLANTMPHVPLFSSEPFTGNSERGPYGDVIEEIDFYTGRILDCLEALGIEENTIVIFTSDNGPWLTKGEEGGSADPLFEGKFSGFEGGHRVPCIIRWPGKIPAGSVCAEITSTIDFHPTLAGLAGAELPAIELDGKDVLDLWLAKEGAESPHEYFFYVHRGQAVRSGDWKYHLKEVFPVKATAREYTGPSLYNLRDDIGEANNVITEYPEVAERLSAQLDAFLSDWAKEE